MYEHRPPQGSSNFVQLRPTSPTTFLVPYTFHRLVFRPGPRGAFSRLQPLPPLRYSSPAQPRRGIKGMTSIFDSTVAIYSSIQRKSLILGRPETPPRCAIPSKHGSPRGIPNGRRNASPSVTGELTPYSAPLVGLGRTAELIAIDERILGRAHEY